MSLLRSTSRPNWQIDRHVILVYSVYLNPLHTSGYIPIVITLARATRVYGAGTVPLSLHASPSLLGLTLMPISLRDTVLYSTVWPSND